MDSRTNGVIFYILQLRSDLMEQKRELWIDYIKVFACVLVVLGHLFQSMTKANILPANDLYGWFDTTIYYFHVSLFFICSGYLYQKLSRVDSVKSWKENVIKKLIALGIPYLSFSAATWVLKTAFSGSVNDQIGGIVDTLFFKPTSQYWYLYCLFLVFLVTPTITGYKSAIALLASAVIGKVLILIGGNCEVYAINTVLSNEIWFVAGMFLFLGSKWLKDIKTIIGVAITVIFIGLSIPVYLSGISNRYISFGLGSFACVGFVLLFRAIVKNENKILSILAKYTLPIFLMHTIFAASIRVILMKIGIQNSLVHVVIGLGISFIGPIIATEIMKKFKWMEFFLYPGKYIKFREKL